MIPLHSSARSFVTDFALPDSNPRSANAPILRTDDIAAVTCLSDQGLACVAAVLAQYGLELRAVHEGAPIPGSYWGAPEAGIIGPVLFARADTPLHSILHTTCHYVCMDGPRRAALHTDCGGTDLEESAVCYLQSLLADTLPNYGRHRLWADMDAWGYSFRLGSAQAWFEQDAGDARRWLREQGLTDAAEQPTGALRI